MRSPVVALFAALLSACAIGVGGEENVPGDAGAQHHDSGSAFPSKDASAAETSAPVDVDAGSTNNNNNTSGCSFSGVLATYDFTGEPGNQTSTKATQTATGVTAGVITRSTVTATTGVDSMNSSNWGMATSVDKTRYYTLTLTPSGSCTLDVKSLSITTQTSSTGPTKAAVATSADQFAATTAFTPNATSSAAVGVSGATGPVEVRVYGFGASGSGGTLRLDTTLTISGALH